MSLQSVSAQQVSTEKVVVGKGRRGESGYREVYCCKCCSRGGRCEDEAHTNTTTVQQDVPRDVGPSAIGRRAKARSILGWRQLASGFADEMEDTGLQTTEDSKFCGIASSIESFNNEGKELIIQQPETSYAAHTGQFGQIVGMLEQMLSHIQSDL